MKYALALEGGGARGAFEVGVWNAIQELNLEITAIAGTSIGAINGAMFASGKDIVSLWREISVQDILDVPDAKGKSALFSYLKSLFRDGGVDATPLRRLLEAHLSEEALRNASIDYGLSTCTAQNMKAVTLFKDEIPKGKMIDYILASACFPLFKPAFIDGTQYIDGGMRNNLPLNMLIQKGHQNIIAVSIRGVGLRQAANACGVNVIEVNAKKAETGILTFDKVGILRSINSGYCTCMHAFGRYVGKQFYFLKDSYFQALSLYGQSQLDRLEQAASLLKIYPYKAYTVEELIQLVLKRYPNHKVLSTFITQLQNSENETLRKAMEAIPGLFDAANAIVYFSKK